MQLKLNIEGSLSLKIVSLVFGLMLIGSASAQEKPSTQVETLLKTSASWDGTAYKSYPSGPPELTVLKITIAPHSALPWHTHPMPNVAYVLTGELTVEKTDGEKRVLKPGDTLPETVDIVHRGQSGDEPVTLIVFYAGTEGMALSGAGH